jgi:NADH-quinone oxidoreductase subunit J
MEINAVLFYILAVLTGACAVAVVLTQNIVRAAAWLLFALAGTAGVFFLLSADFVGATQLLVYVGGTLVLVVFGVMLTAQGPFISMRVGAAEWAIALGVGLLLYGVLAVCLVQMPPPDPDRTQPPAEDLPGAVPLGQALLGSTSATPDAQVTGVTSPPGAHLTARPRTRVAYLLPFEIVSIHLLVVLIGAAYLARAKRRRSPLSVPAEARA